MEDAMGLSLIGEGAVVEDYEYEDVSEDVTPSTNAEIAAYFAKVSDHIEDANVLEGEQLEGDPILIFCNNQPYELDPSAGVKTPAMLEMEWGMTLVNGPQYQIAQMANNDKEISLTLSAPRITTIAQMLEKATVPSDGQLTMYHLGNQVPETVVRAMDAEKAEAYGLSVTWLKGMNLADL